MISEGSLLPFFYHCINIILFQRQRFYPCARLLVHRFLPEQRNNLLWTNERSHEAYAKNYNIVFPHDQPLTGRNFKTGPFHTVRLASAHKFSRIIYR